MKAECVLEAGCWLGEGPVWDDAGGHLYWTDVPSRRLHRWSPASGAHESWETAEMITAIGLRRRGGLIVARAHDLAFFDPETGETTPFIAPEADRPDNRSNDGRCDRHGRFWYGTMSNNLAPDGSEQAMHDDAGSLYCVEGDGSCRRVESGVTISNTLCWSPDEETFYFADTPRGIFAYAHDAATGTLGVRRPFAPQGRPDLEGLGFPDGSAIDAEGFLWSCRWDGGCVIRFAPDGTIDRIVELPCRRVTSATFGGTDLSTLFITTVRYGLDAAALADQPLAGGIFAVDAGVRGLPEGRFAG